VPCHRALVDLGGIQSAGRHLSGDGGRRIRDLCPAAVVHAELEREHVVALCPLLGLLELVDHAAPQPPPPSGPAHADADGVQLVAPSPDHLAVEPHQEPHLVR